MRDTIDGRIWAEHHEQFSSDLHAFLNGVGSSIRRGFERLNAIQFAAPWRSRRGTC